MTTFGGPESPEDTEYALEDMTLRDYYAGLAMQAFICNENLLQQMSALHPLGSEMSVAVCAYEQADAMLEARKA